MYIIVYLWLTIAFKTITANNWTVDNEGNCFYTVISTNISEIATDKISTCDNIDPYVTFIISNSSNNNVLSNCINTTFNSWIRILKAANSTWRTIFPLAFSNLKNVLSIDLSENHIKNINTAFKGLEVLDSLNLSRNDIEEINSDTFTTSENETRLHLLDLSYNLLSHVHKNLFEKIPNLRMLYLQGNKISILGDDFFEHLKKLVHLNICCNILTTLNTPMNELVSLTDLDASYNEISVLSNNTLVGLVSLKTLDLSHNKIEALPPHFLEDSTFLLSVNLKYNKIYNISNYVSYQSRKFMTDDDIINDLVSET